MENKNDVVRLEQSEKRIAILEKRIEALNEQIEEKDLIIHAVKTDQVNYKVDIINKSCVDMNDDIPTKQIKIGDYYYAFLRGSDGLVLLSCPVGLGHAEMQFTEVQDLTELKVWEYQEIKSYAVAVGMLIDMNDDIFI
tara:strand:- start:21501 stop:21914 length:414 start_codon:yes stop_codon:yes gene_type:complete